MLVDLSYPLSSDDKSNWPGNHPFRMNVVSEGSDNPAGCFISHYNISMSEHVGTHIDAPFHFNPAGLKTDELPLENLVDVNAVVIDISHKCALSNAATLDAEDIQNWSKENGPLPSRPLVIMRAGWGQYYYKDPVKFLGTESDQEQNLEFPGFGKSGIDWLVENTDFVGIGVDTLSIELGVRQGCYVHQTLTKHNKYGLECLANLESLPPSGLTVTVLPLKIKGGSGGPTRVVAKVKL